MIVPAVFEIHVIYLILKVTLVKPFSFFCAKPSWNGSMLLCCHFLSQPDSFYLNHANQISFEMSIEMSNMLRGIGTRAYAIY